MQAWERFKDLLLPCPHHGFEKWRTISFFYDRLSPKTKKLVETTCYGDFMDNDEDETEEYFEWLADHVPEWEP